MTTPPYGPYGQDPSATNPYGQNPYWGAPPQGGPTPGAPPPAGPPMGGPPPGIPYQPPPGYPPYPGAPYGAAPYPLPGQPFPPGGPMGPYMPGPPPRRPGSKTPWLIGAAVVVVLIGVLVAALVLFRGGESESNTAGPSSPPSAGPLGPSSTPGGPSSAQNATGCTPNVSAGAPPTGDTVRAGALSFPTSAAPGWAPVADQSMPNGIDVVGVMADVPGAENWAMQAEVGITNFVATMDDAAQASKLMTCVADGPGYERTSPSLGPTKTSSITVDGSKAARVDADVTISDPSRGVKGDSVVIIVVSTKPATFFLGASPIGDAEARATIEQVISALKVSSQ